MSCVYSPTQFVSKYKLISQPLRLKCISQLREMPYLYDDDELLNIYDDLIINLCWFEKCVSGKNYKILLTALKEDVYRKKSKIYYDVMTNLLNFFHNKQPIVTPRDVVKFNKKHVIRQIKEEVAYRPGNVGYEKTKEHFENQVSNFFILS